MQYQFICVACSISFTSLDNLTTHQTYYCTKKTNDEKLKKCGKCKVVVVVVVVRYYVFTKNKRNSCLSTYQRNVHIYFFQVLVNGDHHCGSCLNSIVTGWKCPCCDVISPTASAAQKHMDTHQSVRAFRCTICKYKGNTLRGMRTHIRVHFDKKNDFQVSFRLF